MPQPSKAPAELLSICSTWAEDLDRLPRREEKIAYFRKMLPALLLNQPLISTILREISTEAAYPYRSRGTLFDNELLLYLDKRRRFSLRMYLHGTGEYTPIHDHSSWGVLGNASGKMEVIKYRREDDGLKEDFARLRVTDRITFQPGQTDTTLALNDGIHQVGNPTDKTLIVINVYGTPIRRLYINLFDAQNNRVIKLFPSRLKKKMVATETLKTMKPGI
jgi:predicted metal-dependent enzyme (double-stranded beta helix superfamily)